MTDATVDPYHGLLETWPVDVLNAASQGWNIVFTKPAIRPVPPIDQISLTFLPGRTPYESCGPDVLIACAVATGYVDPAQARPEIGNCVSWINTHGGNVAANGSTAQQLSDYAATRGWTHTVTNDRAGDLDSKLTNSGQVGIVALNTAYGAGPLWNTLHPQQGGPVGHWEAVGAVQVIAQGETPMTPDEKRDVAKALTRLTYAAVLHRGLTQADMDNWAGQMQTNGYDTTLTGLLAAPEAVTDETADYKRDHP